MPFVKGQSGNPGGRPKEDLEVRRLARAQTKAAIKRLVYWMKSENPKASVTACMALLDRGYGKPAQSVDLTNSDGSLASAWAAAKAEMDQIEQEPEAPVIN